MEKKVVDERLKHRNRAVQLRNNREHQEKQAWRNDLALQIISRENKSNQEENLKMIKMAQRLIQSYSPGSNDDEKTEALILEWLWKCPSRILNNIHVWEWLNYYIKHRLDPDTDENQLAKVYDILENYVRDPHKHVENQESLLSLLKMITRPFFSLFEHVSKIKEPALKLISLQFFLEMYQVIDLNKDYNFNTLILSCYNYTHKSSPSADFNFIFRIFTSIFQKISYKITESHYGNILQTIIQMLSPDSAKTLLHQNQTLVQHIVKFYGKYQTQRVIFKTLLFFSSLVENSDIDEKKLTNLIKKQEWVSFSCLQLKSSYTDIVETQAIQTLIAILGFHAPFVGQILLDKGILIKVIDCLTHSNLTIRQRSLQLLDLIIDSCQEPSDINTVLVYFDAILQKVSSDLKLLSPVYPKLDLRIILSLVDFKADQIIIGSKKFKREHLYQIATEFEIKDAIKKLKTHRDIEIRELAEQIIKLARIN